MKFEYYNPNPDAKTFKSGKPKSWNRNDSAVRSICKYTGRSWDDVFIELTEIAKKTHDIPISKNVVSIYCENHNINHVTLGKPTVGQKRPTIAEFVLSNKGSYILYLRDYYVTVIDGTVYDVNDKLDNEAIYSYWQE